MAGTTVTSSTTIGIDLTLTSQNPVFIATTGTIAVSNTSASAIYAAQGVTGTITNNGKLTASHGYGVRLLSGGTITNGSAALTSARRSSIATSSWCQMPATMPSLNAA